MFRVHYLTFGLSRCRGGVTFFLDEKSYQKNQDITIGHPHLPGLPPRFVWPSHGALI